MIGGYRLETIAGLILTIIFASIVLTMDSKAIQEIKQQDSNLQALRNSKVAIAA